MNAVLAIFATVVCVALAKPAINPNSKLAGKRDCISNVPLTSCEDVWCREACKRHKLPLGNLEDYQCCEMDCLSGKYPHKGEKGDFEGHKMKVMDAFCRFGNLFNSLNDLADLNCCASFQPFKFF